MKSPAERAVAIVGLGALLPDASSPAEYWSNLLSKRDSITETPAERWRIADYWDPDPAVPDKTYSKIGGWVRGDVFDWKRFHTPPRVAAAMDGGQKWAVTVAAAALEDYGWPKRPLDLARTGVVLGAAMGGELHYLTTLRINFPEYAKALANVTAFAQLPAALRAEILARLQENVAAALPPITEDSMPGELPNIISGRVANLLDLRGPNFTTDAACASSLAAMETAVELLADGRCDAVLTGGVDRNMGPSSFVKFCKIGALSATGSRPFAEGADGFVMGEGAAIFVAKRLADAERDGDRVYAVVRGVGGASDGHGKGITAPNPAGQKLAMERAWAASGLDPAHATLVEAHGTSTKVGDVVEVASLAEVFKDAPKGAIALGSAKSNIGHLKAAAGAAGLLKSILALHHKVLPPTLHAERPNPEIDFGKTPFRLSTEACEWTRNGHARSCGVSAYGFGGTNFHVVLEEHVPGALSFDGKKSVAVPERPPAPAVSLASALGKAPLRGLVALGADSPEALAARVEDLARRVADGAVPGTARPDPAELAKKERLVFDFGSGPELLDRLAKAKKAFAIGPAAFRPLTAQGIFRASGPRAGLLAFLFPGQGSQYVDMARALAEKERVVADVFAEADRVSAAALGRPLTSFIFADADDSAARSAAEEALKQTSITQPAVLAVDVALGRLLREYGFHPDFVMGHSLGEYAGLVAAGILPFPEAVEASMARGREMTRVTLEDNGAMAAVMAPLAEVEATLARLDGYAVVANLNSRAQCVIGGDTETVLKAIRIFQKDGYTATRIPVSHAFHTRIVAAASKPLREVLDRLHVSSPSLPLVANVTGGFYPSDLVAIKDLLEKQIASPVQWVSGLETLHAAGARTFVEVGPKKALKSFVDDVLGADPSVVSLFTNHPKPGEIETFNHALAGLWAAGHGLDESPLEIRSAEEAPVPTSTPTPVQAPAPESLEKLLSALASLGRGESAPLDRNRPPKGSVVVSGTGLGLPGAEKPVMDPANVERILRGEQLVDLLPQRFRKAMARMEITRVVKGEDGSGRFATIEDENDVIKLAGRPGPFDLTEEYGVPEKLVEALDATTQLAIAAGLDALREAGIPLVRTWKKTTTGRFLPDRWLLPEPLRDETGVIFASAFPGYDRFADEIERFHEFESRRARLAELEALRAVTRDPATLAELTRRVAELKDALAREPYTFDRRFLFRVLAMGHSQFAEYVGARGPNTQVNSACASTAVAIGIAEDWIRAGRCRRVIVVSADDATSERLLPWIGAGFLASGAGATDDRIEDAALPFDRRRHGTLLGMGAAALVVEAQDAVEERGMRGIVELLSTETRNSAFHGTRLDVDHIAGAMESLVSSSERRFGLSRLAMASETVFVSHETFTPARGGSASAEVAALRKTFGAAAREVVVANTKGFTGHPMGVGVEDVIGVKILEHGIVPPVPNLKEEDPELGPLNLSRGGRYPVTYAIHLAAGFGSQIALTLTRRIPGSLERVESRGRYMRWLSDVSGQDRVETEIVKRVLRVAETGAPARPPVPSAWSFGLEPVGRAPAPGAAAFVSAPAIFAAVPLPPPTAPRPEPVVVAPVAKAAATPVPAPKPEPVPAPAPTSGVDPVAVRVLEIVAEKTGYPPEMLDPELDLEADLGVDTVKQAETFAAVRAAFDIPRQENLKLRDFPTIKHVVKFVYDNRPDVASAPLIAAPVPARAVAVVASAPVAAPETAVAVLEPPPVAIPTAAPPPAVAPSPVEADVLPRVLAIVAEKTGYPPEMLDPDLDLEADLGVDTVKQAEVFAAVRAAFAIPKQETLKLRDFPTLKHVVGFVLQNRPRAVEAPSEAPVAPAAAERPKPAELADADRLPRRVPVPSLRPPLDLMKPTGIALSGARVAVVADQGGVADALAGKLTALGATPLLVPGATPTDALVAQLAAWQAERPLAGVYWLPALDVEPELEELDHASFAELCRVRVKSLHAAMRALSGAVGGRGTFLVSGTRLGGLHGYGEEPATAPLGGAVTGFVKAFSREAPEALVKAVDVGARDAAGDVARTLVDETLHDPGCVEIGVRSGRRFTIALAEAPAADGRPGLALSKDSVFVVTGAAGGITSAIVRDLAAASGGTFYLLDLVQDPGAGNEDVALFRKDREALKRRLAEEMKAKGERVTPVAVEKRLFAIERLSAARAAVESVERAGGAAVSRSVNLLDANAVRSVVDEVRTAHGRIDVLVHAGGIEISRSLADKDPGEFELVFDIKAQGWHALLSAAKGLPIGAAVAFSSIAGRFGNSGQTDYSAANDFLCKSVSALRRTRPATRAIAIDWTAWAGIGMATRGSIPKLLEAAGIEALPPEAGIPTVRRELTAGGTSGEVLVAGRLGVMEAARAEDGALDVSKLVGRKLPLFDGAVSAACLADGLTVATTLDPALQPFLFDHRIDGVPVLPGVMGLEAFAELTALFCPGTRVSSVEDVAFLAPFKFHRDKPATLLLSARARPAAGGALVVETTLESSVQPRPEVPAQKRLHFTARLNLTREPGEAPRVAPPSADALPISREAIYRVFFHGPAYRVLQGASVSGDTAVGRMADGLPPDVAPEGARLLFAPRLVELALQTAGVQEIAANEILALPSAIRSLRVWGEPAPGAAVFATAVAKAGGGRDVTVADEAGRVLVEIEGYRTSPLPGRASFAAGGPA